MFQTVKFSPGNLVDSEKGNEINWDKSVALPTQPWAFLGNIHIAPCSRFPSFANTFLIGCTTDWSCASGAFDPSNSKLREIVSFRRAGSPALDDSRPQILRHAALDVVESL